VCERRDPKGLYREAQRAQLRDFIGIDSPYEAPESPDLTLNTADVDISTCTDELVAFVLPH
jgi:adenylylsulfate kinase